MSAKPSMSRESAEEALRQADWVKAWDYWFSISDTGAPAFEWLRTMEASVLPHAIAGDLTAQQNLGSIGDALYMTSAPDGVESLERGVKWIVIALRRDMRATGLEMLVAGYGALRARGVHVPEVEAYLSEPEPREAWRRWTGKDTLA
jgi:hypothetical protein